MDGSCTPSPPVNVVARPWAVWGWLVLALLIAVQYLLFRGYTQREIAWAYPAHYDQCAYLDVSYQTYESLRTEGAIGGLWHAFRAPWPNGALFHVEAAAMFLLLGPGRLSALTVGFLHFALLQVALAGTLLWLTRRWSVALLGLGLLLTAASPFLAAGGLEDFRLDFTAACLYGVLLCVVVRSGVFASRAWSPVVGAAAAYLVLFRHLTLLYVVGLATVFLPYLCLRWLLRRGDAEARRVELRRLTGFALAGAVLFLVVAPVIWDKRESLWQYYVVGHVTGPAAAVCASPGIGQPLYYAASLLYDHAGLRFNILAAAALLLAAALTALRPLRAHGKPDLRFWVAAAVLALLAFVATGTGFAAHNCPPAAGAIVLALALGAALWRRAAARPETPTRLDLGVALPFLAAALVVPLVVLTLDPARSDVVADVALPALVWVVLAALISSLGLHRDEAAPPRMGHGLTLLAGVAMGAAAMTQVSCYGSQGPLTRQRADVERVLAMHDLIARHAERQGWQSPTFSVTAIGCDYLNPRVAEVLAYERHGVVTRLRNGLGVGVIAMPEAEAMDVAGASDFLLIVRPEHPIFPFDESMLAILPRMRELAQRRFTCLGTFRIYKDEITVYARRSMEVRAPSSTEE